ncbi:hypothetical protein [Qipengyuania sp. SM2507]
MTHELRTRLYLVAAHIGGIATVLLAVSLSLALPDFVRGVSIGMLLVSLLMLLHRKLRDEYMEGLWNAGTSFAFVVTVAWFLFSLFVLGSFTDPTGLAPALNPYEAGLVCTIAAFFIGFHIRWLRGRS